MGTQAPFSIKLSTEETWRGSSRVISRTKTLVSTARIALSGVPADAVFQLIKSSRFRLPCPKYRLVNIGGGEASRATHNDVAAIFLPFQNGTGTDAEFSAYVHWDGNLSLRRNLRLRDSHDLHY